MVPVEAVEPTDGADARLLLAQCTGNLITANRRLVRSGEWYRSIKTEYEKK